MYKSYPELQDPTIDNKIEGGETIHLRFIQNPHTSGMSFTGEIEGRHSSNKTKQRRHCISKFGVDDMWCGG